MLKTTFFSWRLNKPSSTPDKAFLHPISLLHTTVAPSVNFFFLSFLVSTEEKEGPPSKKKRNIFPALWLPPPPVSAFISSSSSSSFSFVSHFTNSQERKKEREMEVEFLCDELIQEILQRLPNSISSSSASRVCKRWLHLHRTSINSLSLRVTPNNSSSLPSFLSRYPHLSSLTIISSSSDTTTNTTTTTLSSDLLLLWVASNCSNLHLLRFFAGPVSPSSLSSLSSFCKHLTSLHISSSSIKSLSFRWLISFPFLKHLSFTNCTSKFEALDSSNYHDSESDDHDDNHQRVGSSSSALPLESLCLSGIGAEEDQGLEWLWSNCTKLRRLQLSSCEGIGVADDSSSASSFFKCLKGLQELELRACRTIVDGVLSHLSEHAGSLNSLLLYDGGSRDGLHRFISRSRSTTLQRLDFRLPLDLDNGHLSLVAENFRGLVSLRLQSCCLVTGEGLKHLGSAMNNTGLEELALINCDVVEREPGLLTTLGQNLRGLKKLDLSYNELMVEKGFVSMIVSCKNLIDIKLRGCKGLKNSSMVCMIKSCKLLESVDIKQCSGIGTEGVEELLLNASPRLRRIQVEETKLSDVAKKWVSQKFIEVVN